MPEDHETALDVLTKRRDVLLRNIESERACVAEKQAAIERMVALIAGWQAEAVGLAFTISRLNRLKELD